MIIRKKYASLEAMGLIQVECSWIGRSTADPSPMSLNWVPYFIFNRRGGLCLSLELYQEGSAQQACCRTQEFLRRAGLEEAFQFSAFITA